MPARSAHKHVRKAFFGGVLIALFLGGGWFLSAPQRGGLSSTPLPARVREGVGAVEGQFGVSPREADSASRAFMGGWYTADGQRYAHLAAQSEDVSDLVAKHPEDETHLDMQRWTLGGLDERALAQTYACDRAHLANFQLQRVCDFKLKFVIRRTGDREGKAVFVQPHLESAFDDQCQAYSDCVAHSVYLGDSVPLPLGADEAISFEQGYRMIPVKDSKTELQARFRREYMQVKMEYEQALSNPNVDPRELERLDLWLKSLELRKDD